MSNIDIGIKYLISNDYILKMIIDTTERCNLKPSDDYFKDLVRSIISQQLSVGAAKSIFQKLTSKCPTISPNAIKMLSVADLQSIGISKQKISFIINLSDFILENSKFFENIENESEELIIAKLCQIKGIGLWTAQMFLIFSLNKLDVLPLGDAGFRRSFKIRYHISESDDLNSEILRSSEMWGQYKSIAAWYLWKDLDKKL